LKQLNKFINNEAFFFFAWVIRTKSWKTNLNWAIEKAIQLLSRRFKYIYHTLHYPSEIQKYLKQNYKAGSASFGEATVHINEDQWIDSPEIITLASCDLGISSGHIDWIKEFEDDEDEESLHRWNWLLHIATKELCTPERLRWMIAMMEDWVECFQHEVNLSPKDLDSLLRWNSYTVGERLANSVLLFHCYNLKPSDKLAKALFEQAKLLTTRLEYFGKNTGNHVCNNARGIYLAGVYFKCEFLCKLARKVFLLELDKMVTADGFLREGSSHYQFLFSRWILEVYYFAYEWGDEEFFGFLEPILKKMLKQCQFFLMNDEEKQKTFPLFGDISPDFPPQWLIDLLDYQNYFSNAENTVPIINWNRLWFNKKHPLLDLNLSNNKKETDNEIIAYPKSGWYRFQQQDVTMFLRADQEGTPDHVGHHHQDQGHFCLYFLGKPILVDGGRLNYHNDFGLWPEAHNCVTLDGLGLVPRKPSRYPRRYTNNYQQVTYKGIGASLNVTFLSDGFSRLVPGLVWCREWQLFENEVRIKDTLDGTSKHELKVYFHWNEALEVVQRDDCTWKLKMDHVEGNFAVKCSQKIKTKIYRGGDSPIGFQVVAYGCRRPSYTLAVTGYVTLPVEIEYILNF
jgi:hypothetical protein